MGENKSTKETSSEIALNIADSRLIETANELVELLSQNKRVFLFGAGSSKCAGLPLMGELTEAVLEKIKSGSKDGANDILNGIKNNFKGSTSCNIEDYMSELVDLISIGKRRKSKKSKINKISVAENDYTIEELINTLDEIKHHIQEIIQSSKPNLDFHRNFINNIHGRLITGKSQINQKVDYFTLNYDTILEDALSLEQISFSDGFNGGATGWWNIDSYDEKLIKARVFKIHGSIDWCLLDDDVLPRRVRSGLGLNDKGEPVLIWPASTKYRETQRDPYAQILEKLRQTLRPVTNNDVVVLTIVGYSFCDTHINYELDRALKESNGALTIIVLTNEDKPEGIIKQWYNDPNLSEQVRIYSNCGYYHADKTIESAKDINWWKFRPLVQLLGGKV